VVDEFAAAAGADDTEELDVDIAPEYPEEVCPIA
jgi:hypothetical protein